MFNELIKLYADKYKIDPVFLTALIKVESGFNPLAIRYEINYRWIYKLEEMTKLVGCSKETMLVMQRTSFGLCQLMGANAYELGLKIYATALLSPELNLKYACMYLNKIIRAQSLQDTVDIYAAYNAGSVRKTKNGEYYNQIYVNKFIQVFEELKKDQGI